MDASESTTLTLIMYVSYDMILYYIDNEHNEHALYTDRFGKPDFPAPELTFTITPPDLFLIIYSM